MTRAAVLLGTVGLLVFSTVGSAAAQNYPAGTMEVFRQKIHSDKRLLIAENMELTDSEAKDFWPLYEKYQKDLDSLEERMRRLIEEYAANFGSMSEKTAGEILEEYILIERNRQKYREYSLSTFRSGSLPRKKVARYFQLETKIQAVQNYELASKIPLVR
jgi:hypothetical protein